MKLIVSFYDSLASFWYGQRTPRLISWILIASFLVGFLLVEVKRLNWQQEHWPRVTNHFFAIDLAFTVLLVVEVLGLIFEFPRSVADSVGKQFEVLSIILLRSAFKEFSHFDEPLTWSGDTLAVYRMTADAFGALIIFFLTGIFYRIQKHKSITEDTEDRDRFVNLKKAMALALLGFYIFFGLKDLFTLFTTAHYTSSFNDFYTVLIFADILLLLYSLRFTTRYVNIFRYSSFAFAAILIRISLSAPAFINVIIGIAAGLFVLALTYAYNYFRRPVAS
jgi:hypothetical protein